MMIDGMKDRDDMTTDENQGIFLDDGISRITLTPSGPIGLGFPTKIEISSGPFSANVEADAWNYRQFRDALVHLHEKLTGEAELTFVEGRHSMTFKGDGDGKIHTKIVLTDIRGHGGAILTVQMLLDQSYLPSVIDVIEQKFLPKRV